MRTQATYLFYDLETTGLNASFDQVLQFAAIRTDMALNELERYQIQVRLNPDIIPSPHAIIVHRIGISIMQQGESELHAIQQIHQILNQPGTISLGYNTLGFDDEFLRFSFFRNLLPPYTHQYANQCSRMDLFPMTVMYYLHQHDTLQWPTVDGRISLKLEHLNASYQWAEGASHDAMVDVEVTLALAKHLKQNNTMWEYLLGFFNKTTDLSRSHSLIHANKHPIALLTHSKLGYKNNFQAPCYHLGQHQHYKNQSLWLRLDQPLETTFSLENIADTTRILRKKPAEAPFILPTKSRYIEGLTQDQQRHFKANQQWVQHNSLALSAIQEHHQNETYPTVDNIDIDAMLYTLPFPSRTEEQLFKRFHQASQKEKTDIAQRIRTPSRQQQALRVIARHNPKLLSDEDHEPFQDHLKAIYSAEKKRNHIIDYRNQLKLTLNQALNETESLINDNEHKLDDQQRSLLAEYKNHLMTQQKHYG